mgnify:CR=1 FL=1
MNKIFKTIWNRARRCYVAVNEAVCGAAQTSGSFLAVVTSVLVFGAQVPSAFAFPKWEGDHDMDYRYIIGDGTVFNNPWNTATEGEYALIFQGSVTVTKGAAVEFNIYNLVNSTISSPKNIFNNYGKLYFSAWANGGNYYLRGNAVINNYADADLTIGYSGQGRISGFHMSESAVIHNSGRAYNQTTFRLNGGTFNNTGAFFNEYGEFVLNGGTFSGEGSYDNQAQATISDGYFRVGSLTLTSGEFNSEDKPLNVGIEQGDVSTGSLTLNGGELNVDGLVQNQGNIVVNNGTYTVDLTHVQGDITNAGELTFTSAVTSDKGTFLNTGTLNIDGNSDIQLTISGNGVVNVLSGQLTASAIDGASGLNIDAGASIVAIDRLATSSITNASDLQIGTLEQVSSVTYTQTNGSLVVTDNWFESSILNLSGGALTRSDLGTNTVNANGADIQVGKLTSNTELHLSNGSVSVGDFDLSSGQTFTQTGGTLTTSGTEIFESLGEGAAEALHVIGINARVPEEVQEKLTELFQYYVPGWVDQNFAEHVSISGGKVVVTGVNLTTTQVADLSQAFKEQLFSRDLHNKTASPRAVNTTEFRKAA